jgi:tetratricopeptide (TPR) repeat protein
MIKPRIKPRIRLARHPLLLALSLLVAYGSAAPNAAAQESSAASHHDASKHFERGATLYGEANYQAALVEFKRAYALSPNTETLYNVAETQYQLQDYAGARSTFIRYLADAGPSGKHKAEVETNLDVLRGRVGRVHIVTVPPGADVSIDDQPVGRTPLDDGLVVSVGRRRIVASIAGRPAATRTVEVAAEDNVSVALELPAEPTAPLPASGNTPVTSALASHPPLEADRGALRSRATLRTVGFVATGVLAAGAIGSGILALKESSELRSARDVYPTSSSTLKHDSDLTLTYSVLADALTGAALLVGASSLISTLVSRASDAPPRRTGSATHLWLGPTSAKLEVTF